jgi:hypothetical protein
MRDHVLTSVTFDCAETVQECAFKKSDTLTGIRFNRGFHSRASFCASGYPFPRDGVLHANFHAERGHCRTLAGRARRQCPCYLIAVSRAGRLAH